MMVSYLPIPAMVGEMKTKPTQTASRTLNSAGIQADVILCRSEEPVDEKEKKNYLYFVMFQKKELYQLLMSLLFMI